MMINNINLKKFLDFTPEKYDREELKYIHFEYSKEKNELEICATNSYILIKEIYIPAEEEEDFKMNISAEDIKKLVGMKIDFLEIDVENKTLNNLKVDIHEEIEYPEYNRIFEELKKDTNNVGNYDISLLFQVSKALKCKCIDENYYKITMGSENTPMLLENKYMFRTTSILIMPIRL